jgi:hypothetical protein
MVALTLPAATLQTITFTDGSTQTITTPTLSGGNATTQLHTLKGSSTAGWNITKGAGAITVDYVSVSNSKALPVNDWVPGTGCTNGGGNTGWLGWGIKGGLIRKLLATGGL